MRARVMSPVAATGVLVLLAACGSKEAAAPAGTGSTAQTQDKQAELKQLESDLAAQETAKPQQASPEVSSKPVASSRPAATKPASTAKPAPEPKPVAKHSVTVPAGTQLELSLSTALSTKTAKVGDGVRAMLTSDVQVDGKTAIARGTSVAGSVVKVVSGSDKIGGTPTLVLAFDRLELPGGVDVPISGEFMQKGKSDNTRDTVKIVGGAAAGAVIGDQVSKKDKGKVIGGLLGAAAGAIAAKETGTEVKLPEGAALSLVLGAPVEITH